MKSFAGRDFISLKDFSRAELCKILELAFVLKKKQKAGEVHHLLAGKTLALIFEKPSTRTRISFEVGIYQLGGHAMVLESVFEREDVKDVGKTLSRYVDGIMLRTFAHEKVLALAEAATVPVINGLSDLLHPCQALADVMTMQELKGDLSRLKVAYVGDGNNVCNSLVDAADIFGFKLAVAAPKGYEPKLSSKNAVLVRDPAEAVRASDVVYTDVWTSMGQEKESNLRRRVFARFQVDRVLMQKAKKDAVVLHCLPAHRGEEIAASVLDGPAAKMFDQAENRLHAQKSILVMLLGK